MSTSRGVIFDLDGTLIDSMPLVLRSYAHALAPSHPSLTPEEILAGLGGPPERYFNDLIPDPAVAAKALRRLQDYLAEHRDAIRPFVGALPLLTELRAAAIAVGLWTGRERESTAWLLKEHGFADWVQTCVCGDDLASHKPDPAGLQAALDHLGVNIADAVFVGDADVDVLAGAALGVRTLLITHERVPPEKVRMKAWKVVSAPAEAYAVLRNELLAV